MAGDVEKLDRFQEILSRYGLLLSSTVLSDEIAELRDTELRIQTLRYAITLFDESAVNLENAAVNLPTYLYRIRKKNTLLHRDYFLKLAHFGKTLDDETVRYNVKAAAVEILEHKDLLWLKSFLSSEKDLRPGAKKLLEELPA